MIYKNTKFLFHTAWISYTSYLALYTLICSAKAMSDHSPLANLIHFAPIVIALLPVFFLQYGAIWARSFLGVASLLIFIIICVLIIFTPISLKEHERTMSLYAMLFFGLLIFGFNTYVFLLNDKTKNYLPQKKESNI